MQDYNKLNSGRHGRICHFSDQISQRNLFSSAVWLIIGQRASGRCITCMSRFSRLMSSASPPVPNPYLTIDATKLSTLSVLRSVKNATGVPASAVCSQDAPQVFLRSAMNCTYKYSVKPHVYQLFVLVFDLQGLDCSW